MIMNNRRVYTNPFIRDQEGYPDEPPPGNAPDSPSSGDDDSKLLPNAPSPKKSRRSMQKRVVSVPIADVEGSKSKGEVYPPSDSWAWRKYGQKPIKGSPYPRGYYRCSTSKGCPARKQVERSRVDPTMLVITYASDHNHPFPTPKSHQPSTATSSATITTTAAAAANAALLTSAKSEDDGSANISLFINYLELELGDDSMLGSSGELGWLGDVVASAAPVFDSPICVGSGCDDSTVGVAPLGDEEESLFADLGELPECSLVFRRRFMEAVPCCGSTG